MVVVTRGNCGLACAAGSVSPAGSDAVLCANAARGTERQQSSSPIASEPHRRTRADARSGKDGTNCLPKRRQRNETWNPLVSNSLKQENSRCDSRKRACQAPETSHAGIIRIGFEGISQPHLVEHPCFNNMIETLPAAFGKCLSFPGHRIGPWEPCSWASAVKAHRLLIS